MKLTAEDLMEKCHECGGNGVAKPVRKENTITQSLAGCSHCRGRGYILTETGESIAKLVEVLQRTR